MTGKSIRAAIAVLLLVFVIALSVYSVSTRLPGWQPTPAILVEEHSTTGS